MFQQASIETLDARRQAENADCAVPAKIYTTQVEIWQNSVDY